jgi:hypothetical protein
MDILLLIGGLLFGAMIAALFVRLARNRFPTPGAALAIGFVATLAGSYVALHLGFWAAERFVAAEIVPQWEAQGHFDNGPSAFLAVGSLAMPLVIGAFIGGLVTTITWMAVRMSK